MADEVGSKDWARRIVERYEAGGRVPSVSKKLAMEVLGIKPGTLIRRGRNPAFDRLAAAAQAD